MAENPEPTNVTSITDYLNTDFIDALDHHDAVDRLKILNRGAGFVITIERTKQDKTALKQTRKVFLRCWKSRPYKSSSTGARRSSTRSTECPWRACLTRQDAGWKVEVKHMEHNHELDSRATPDRTILRRQKPQAPLRALAALTPYPVPGAPTPSQPRSSSMQYTPQQYPTANSGPQYTPQQYLPAFGQFQVAPPQHPGPVSQPQFYNSTTPPGMPPGASQFAPPTSAPANAPAHAAAPSYAGRGRQRRAGYAVMSEIKRYQFPLEQRRIMTPRTPFAPESPCFVVIQDEFNAILGDNPDLLIAYEDKFPFAHGAGIYSPQRDEVYMTSRHYIPPKKTEKAVMISKLMRKEDDSWVRKEILTLAVMCNGGTNYVDGNLIFCAQGDYRDPGGLVHIEADYPHRMSIMLNNYMGRHFNSLNDVAMHSDGSMWFTDPIYGFEEGLRPKPELPNQVYRFDPQTGDLRVVADGFGRPKGICFSPYEKIVYITDTDAFHGDGSIDKTRSATIYAYDILEKRNTQWLTNRRVFAMPDTGVPDGIKCDMAGNVYAGCGDGLNVWSSGGVLLGKVLIPGGITNFCFGRAGELFLLNETRFWIMTVAPSVKGGLLRQLNLQGNEREEGHDSDGDDSMASLFGGENGGNGV